MNKEGPDEERRDQQRVEEGKRWKERLEELAAVLILAWKTFSLICGILAVLIGVAWLVQIATKIPWQDELRVITVMLVLVLTGLLLKYSASAFMSETRRTPVRYIISLNCAYAVLIGAAASVLACWNWEVALLLAGVSLFCGGFLGLLFGYPQGVAQQQTAVAVTAPATQANSSPQNEKDGTAGGATAKPETTDSKAEYGAKPNNGGAQMTTALSAPAAGLDPAAPAVVDHNGTPAAADPKPNPAAQGPKPPNPPPSTNARAQNLVAESAATLGKVIAGFGLAKAGDFETHFGQLAMWIGPALKVHGMDGVSGQEAIHYSGIVAGCIIAYFLATGFLSGLLLPSYFMRDFLGGDPNPDV